MRSADASSMDGRAVRVMLVSVGAVLCAIRGRVWRSLPTIRPLPPTVHHEGREFPVLDLPRLFGVGRGESAEGGDLMLLLEQDDLRRALVVDGLGGFSELDPEALQPVPDTYPEAERRRWEGLLPRPDGGVLAVLRLAALPAGTAAGEGLTDGGR